MRIIGCSAIGARPVIDELRDASFAGRPAFVWLDGDDITAVVGEHGDDVGDVLKMVRRTLPELCE